VDLRGIGDGVRLPEVIICHLGFLTNPHVKQSLQQSSVVAVAELENMGTAIEISLM
jgi:hypothetical protein